MKKIIIIGAGGHGKVVFDAIQKLGSFKVVGFVDANLPLGTLVVDQQKVLVNQSNLSAIQNLADCFIVAIGNNKIRQEIFEEALQYCEPATIIHPKASIGHTTNIGEGTVILSNVTISSNTTIGKNVIINANTVVDHDCTIGNDVHLKIGTLVGSNSKISDFTLTNIGEIIKEFSEL